MAKSAISNLQPIQQLILDKIKFEAARDLVTQGEYDVNLDLHIQGKIKVGEDFFQVCWQKLRPLAILQFALNKLNANCRQAVLEEAFEWYTKMTEAQREAANEEMSGMLKAAEESLKQKTENERLELEATLPEIKAEVKEDTNTMKCWAIQKTRGRVTFSGMNINVKQVEAKLD